MITRNSGRPEEAKIGEKRLNILFTCGGRRVALLEAFRDAMRGLGVGGELTVTDVTPASAAYQLADTGVTVPRCDDPGYLPALERTVSNRSIGLLVPLTDLDLALLAGNRQRFAELGCTVMVGEPEAIAVCRDKARTARVATEAGLAALETTDLAGFRARPFYPCFARPVGGSGGIGAAEIRNEADLEAHVERFGEELILQPRLDGQEFTVDVYRDRQGAVRCVVPRQRLAVRSGEVEKGVTVRDEEIIEATKKLSAALEGLWGVYCCQCIRPPGSVPHFFEVNPRFGGGVPLSIAAGADLPRYLLQEVMGLPVDAGAGGFQEDLLMLRYDRAVYLPAGDRRALPGFDRPRFR